MKLYYFIMIGLLLLIRCGIFSPRTDFELPESKKVEDPFNFGSLLDGSGEQFSKLDWYELFDSDFKYTNVRLGNIEYGQKELINQLNQQEEIYPDVEVKWVNDEGFPRDVDIITLSNISYTVFNPAQPDTILFSGISQFVIRRDQTKIWRILEWTDEPTNESFFSPAE